MPLAPIRGRAIAAITAAAVGLTAGGVALASTPGTTSAATGPKVYVAFHNDDIRLPFVTPAKIGQVTLPAGSYTVTAKAWVTSVAGLGDTGASCKLTLGKSSDQARVDAQDGGVSAEPVRNGVLGRTVSGTVASGVNAVLSCVNLGGGNTDLKYVKITAVTVGSVSKQGF